MIHITISIAILLITGLAYLQDIPEMSFLMLELSILNIVVYCIRDLRNRMVLLFFIISFFVLLVSRVVISRYFDVSEFIYQTEDEMFPRLFLEIYTQLIVAMNCAFLAYFIITRKNRFEECQYDFNSKPSRAIRNASRNLAYVCFVFLLYALYRRISGVLVGGYGALYMDTEDLDIPFIVSFFANKFEMCMCLFLSTMPSKKEAKIPLIIFALSAVLSLFTGQRNGFVIPILFLVLYMYIRNDVPVKEKRKWISGRFLFAGLMLTPFLFVLMYLVMVIRGGKSSESGDIINLFLGSVYQLGSSVQVIHDTIFFHDELAKQDYYSLEPIIDFLVHNPFTDWIFQVPHYEPFSVDMALHGRSLGYSITYITQPERYFMGGSMGTSYIAEAWIDFGYIGIVIYSCIYGVVLGKVVPFCKKNILFSFLSLYSMMQIIYAPRFMATTFVSRFLEVKSWPFFLIIIMVYLAAKNNRKKKTL